MCALFLSVMTIGYALVVLSRSVWIPTFDNALIWLRSMDVGTRNTPLVGPFSRFGWDHPGPAIYYILALFLRALGSRPTALLVGSLVTAMVSTAATLVLVLRHAGLGPGLVLAMSLLGLSYGLGNRLINPWNPFIFVLPFVLFMVCVWLWSHGRHRMLPLAVAAGSFCVQCHVGVTVAVLVVATTGFVLRLTAGPITRGEKRTILVSVILGLVIWAPPLFQQLTGDTGNLGFIARFFFIAAPEDPPLGAVLASRIAAHELSPWGSWLGFQGAGVMAPAPAILLGVPIGLLAVTAAMARRFRDTLMLRLMVLAAVGVAASIWSFANIHGPAMPYLAVWTRVVAMLCVALPLMVVGRRIYESAPRRRLTVATVACLVLAGQGLVGITVQLPDSLGNRILQKFVPAIENAVPPGARVRVVASGVPFTVSPEPVAVVLLRAGRVPLVRSWEARRCGPHRFATGSEVLPTLAWGSGPAIDELAARPNGRLIASYDPVSRHDRMEAKRLRDLLVKQLEGLQNDKLIHALDDGREWLLFQQLPQVDSAMLRRYMKLVGGDERRAYALFLFPPTTW